MALGQTEAPAPSSEGQAAYDKLVETYLRGPREDLAESLKQATRLVVQLNPKQRQEVDYIRRTSAAERPSWWESTKSPANVSFVSVIWDKKITANYMPSEDLGAQAPIDIKGGRLVNIVTWRPALVDSPKAAKGALATRLGITDGHIGEVIVWHELGHNLISTMLTAQQAIELYTSYRMLYMHLQEFFADVTAIYHATPRARLTAMLSRLDSLDEFDENEPHARAAYAIGVLFMTDVLANPANWPSVHLPPAVPETEAERLTLIYLYEHIDAGWTLAEDKALRDLAYRTVKVQGDTIFRAKGVIPLPNKLTVCLMAAQDRPHMAKREAWVKESLKKAIDAGLADKPQTEKKGKGKSVRETEQRIRIPW